jgi:SIR2-like domain
MEINVDRSLLKDEEVPIELLIAQIASGKAILFTGAGFSADTTNINDKEPPDSRKLAREICRLGKFDEDDDLRFAADYFLQYKDKSALIELLRETFTLKAVNKSHIDICKAKWKKYYTTNYDNSIELANALAGKLVECVDLEDIPSQHYKKKGICIHLNGSILRLNAESIQTSFKLSTSSYISPDSFLNSDWHYPFKQDLERCSAIVFVGYSLYDIEIQKILFENSSLKHKTYFVTRQNPDPKSKFTMSKFGYVLPIGCNGFAELLNNNPKTAVLEETEFLLESLVKYELSFSNETVRDADIETMLMFGQVNQKFVESAVLGEQNKPYLIVRDYLSDVLDFLQSKRSLVITSEFGNGKSILVSELLPYLTEKAFDVYTISDGRGDYIGDLEKLARTGIKTVLIVDGYEAYLDLVKHFTLLSPNNIFLILTARSSDHDRLKAHLHAISFPFSESNIDFLNENESSFFIKILDNMGAWGQERLSLDAKERYLMDDNHRQISLALLNLFKSPQILHRVREAIGDLFDTPSYKDTIFSIAMLETLGLEPNSSIISEVALNDAIYNGSFRQNPSFKQLFKISGNRVISKSSLFCLSLINNHYDASYISNQLQKIAREFSRRSKGSFIEEKIFKSTLKFSFVERLLPSVNKKSNLYKYYEDLKTSVPWLMSDPHYWLQYGMARLPYKDYPKAQSYFDQAYGLAKSKRDYHTRNIDTQQARLFILKAIETADQAESYSLFMDGHKLLSGLDDDVYKFRQVEKYRDYFESKYKSLSKKNKLSFQTYCTNMLRSLEKSATNGYVNMSNQKSFGRVQENLNLILARSQET